MCVCPQACAVTGVAVSFLCSLSHVGCSDMCSLATKAELSFCEAACACVAVHARARARVCSSVRLVVSVFQSLCVYSGVKACQLRT